MRIKACLLASVFVMSSTAAIAQQSSETTTEDSTAETPPSADAQGSEAIIVTGSRVSQSGFSAPNPVTILSSEDLQLKSATNIPDALNQLPQFQNSTSQNQSYGFLATQQVGNILNLRNLGGIRTLILQDGMRVPPTNSDGTVDSNLIPQMLVSRVDVVTGGASAAYGADAVSGVVNFILDTKYNGLKLVANTGVSERGDGFNYRVGAAGGISLADDRIHLLASAEHFRSEGIIGFGSRPNGDAEYLTRGVNGVSAGREGSAANPFGDFRGARYSTVRLGGSVLAGPLAGYRFLPDGGITPVGSATIIAPGLCISCADGVTHNYDQRSLVPSLATDQAFGRVSLELGNTELWAQANYGRTKNRYNAATEFYFGNATIFSDNVFLDPAAQTILANGNATSFGLYRFVPEAGNIDVTQKSTTLNTSIGAKGRIADFLDWDAFYSHGRTQFNGISNETDNVRFRAALDAVAGPGGTPVCRVTLTNPGLYPDCQPLNLFGEGAPSQAALNYIQGQSRWKIVNKLDNVGVNFRMQPFSTWAGPVSLAFGAEYRDQSLLETTNSDPSQPPVTTGIIGFAGSHFFITNVPPARGSVNVKEFYAEALVPLASGTPFLDELTVSGAVRFADYSTSGGIWTWKGNVTWAPFDDLRFRVTRSRDVRAPTLFELFGGTQNSLSGVNDPHTGVLNNVITLSGGNPSLRPEIADTLTAGIVYNPSWLSRFNLAIDFYRIRVADAISSPFTPIQIIQICEESNGTNEQICGLVNRPLPFSDRTPANYPISVSLANLNVASLLTQGLDVELSYRFAVGNGDLSVRMLGTYLDKFDVSQFAGLPTSHFAGNADQTANSSASPLPRVRGSLELNYTNGGFNFWIQERLIGGLKKSITDIYVDNKIPAIGYTDLSLSYDFDDGPDKTELFFRVDNLFDKFGPVYVPRNGAPSLNYPTLRQLYDVVGRRFTVGFRGEF